MDWGNNLILRLIDVYREKTILWDVKDVFFKNKKKKEDAWEEIAREFDTSTSDVKKKINSLLASFRRERQKIIKPSGAGTEDIYDRKWFAFKRQK